MLGGHSLSHMHYWHGHQVMTGKPEQPLTSASLDDLHCVF